MDTTDPTLEPASDTGPHQIDHRAAALAGISNYRRTDPNAPGIGIYGPSDRSIAIATVHALIHIADQLRVNAPTALEPVLMESRPAQNIHVAVVTGDKDPKAAGQRIAEEVRRQMARSVAGNSPGEDAVARLLWAAEILDTEPTSDIGAREAQSLRRIADTVTEHGVTSIVRNALVAADSIINAPITADPAAETTDG